MAENIIEGLFGVNPNQLRQQQYQQDYIRAADYAKLDPFQQGTMALYQGAAGLARPIAGMMDMVNPQEEEARQKQAVMSQGGDLNTPEGLMAKAEQFRQAGDMKTAFQLSQLAQQRKQEQAKLSLEQAKAKREDWRIGEEFEWKKQQAKDALEARMEQARMRSEDMRLSTDQRAEAARDANATRLQIAQLMASIKTSASDTKKSESMQKREEGRETVDNLVSALRDSYEQLQKMGSITDPSKGAISNIGTGIASSGIGQTAGRLFGTKAQSLRNQIAQQRPLLLQSIKEATGMSAKQMDSNVELKMYLAASTDPSLDIKANLAALNKLSELYGLGKKQAPTGATGNYGGGKAKFLGFE